MEHVRVLNVAAATAFGKDAGVIGALNGDAAVSVKPVVYVHAATRVVDIGAGAVGTSADDAAVGGADFMASSW
jgi:hydrogenase maturation factor